MLEYRFLRKSRSPPALAGSGVAELTIDRAALHALFAATLPRTETIEVGGLEPFRVTIDGIESLAFREGGVEARVHVRLSGGLEGIVEARYVPRVEATSGVIGLTAESAYPVAPLRLDLDLAGLLPTVDLPRRFEWTLPLDDRPVKVELFLQGVTVEQERLQLQLGVGSAKSR